MEIVPDEHRHQKHDSLENSTSLENDSMLLPHDRVGSDFSWLQAQSQEESAVQKADELEDEESFLYGNEDTGGKQAIKSSTTLFASISQIGGHAKLQDMDSVALGSQQHQNRSVFSNVGDVIDLKQPLQITSSSLVNLDSSECEKIKTILKSLGTADISEIMVKMQGQKEGKQIPPVLLGSEATAAGLTLPALNNPNVRQALESLQSLIKATKEKRAKRDGSGTSQTSSDKHKAGDEEERKREKQARISKMESLMKELEELLKQDGLSFLTPVIGFYCQKCEEFIGDLNSAENHANIHHHSNSSSQIVQMDNHAKDSKGHLHYFKGTSSQHSHPSDRRVNKDYGYHRDSEDHGNHRDWKDERDHRSKHNDDHRGHRAKQENISLKEEMRKERMLITVSRGRTPPPDIKVKEEVNNKQAIGSHSKVEDTDKKGKSSKESREKDNQVKDESSESSDDNKGKTHKAKSPKKKKKKEKKNKKKKEKGNKS